jgi:ribonuclease HIII
LNFVATLTDEEAARLEDLAQSGRFERREVPYARFSIKGEGVTCTLYDSGKCVIQGKGLEQFVAHHLPERTRLGASRTAGPDFTAPTVGSDESGKGDYFGPLVVAAVGLSPKELVYLEEARITDSKAMRPAAIKASAAEIERMVEARSVVAVSPEKYNELYPRFRSLNPLLAWCHGRAIENVLERYDAEIVVVDKFCDETTFRRGLLERGRKKELVLRTRAESHPAVGAASILASAAFTRALERLSREFDVVLPKGSSSQVTATARRLLRNRGPEVLRRVAKLHFSITGKLEV